MTLNIPNVGIDENVVLSFNLYFPQKKAMYALFGVEGTDHDNYPASNRNWASFKTQ
jgi:hypothetical protein